MLTGIANQRSATSRALDGGDILSMIIAALDVCHRCKDHVKCDIGVDTSFADNPLCEHAHVGYLWRCLQVSKWWFANVVPVLWRDRAVTWHLDFQQDATVISILCPIHQTVCCERGVSAGLSARCIKSKQLECEQTHLPFSSPPPCYWSRKTFVDQIKLRTGGTFNHHSCRIARAGHRIPSPPG